MKQRCRTYHPDLQNSKATYPRTNAEKKAKKNEAPCVIDSDDAEERVRERSRRSHLLHDILGRGWRGRCCDSCKEERHYNRRSDEDQAKTDH